MARSTGSFPTTGTSSLRVYLHLLSKKVLSRLQGLGVCVSYWQRHKLRRLWLQDLRGEMIFGRTRIDKQYGWKTSRWPWAANLLWSDRSLLSFTVHNILYVFMRRTHRYSISVQFRTNSDSVQKAIPKPKSFSSSHVSRCPL